MLMLVRSAAPVERGELWGHCHRWPTCAAPRGAPGLTFVATHTRARGVAALLAARDRRRCSTADVAASLFSEFRIGRLMLMLVRSAAPVERGELWGHCHRWPTCAAPRGAPGLTFVATHTRARGVAALLAARDRRRCSTADVAASLFSEFRIGRLMLMLVRSAAPVERGELWGHCHRWPTCAAPRGAPGLTFVATHTRARGVAALLAARDRRRCSTADVAASLFSEFRIGRLMLMLVRSAAPVERGELWGHCHRWPTCAAPRGAPGLTFVATHTRARGVAALLAARDRRRCSTADVAASLFSEFRIGRLMLMLVRSAAPVERGELWGHCHRWPTCAAPRGAPGLTFVATHTRARGVAALLAARDRRRCSTADVAASLFSEFRIGRLMLMLVRSAAPVERGELWGHCHRWPTCAAPRGAPGLTFVATHTRARGVAALLAARDRRRCSTADVAASLFSEFRIGRLMLMLVRSAAPVERGELWGHCHRWPTCAAPRGAPGLTFVATHTRARGVAALLAARDRRRCSTADVAASLFSEFRIGRLMLMLVRSAAPVERSLATCTRSTTLAST